MAKKKTKAPHSKELDAPTAEDVESGMAYIVDTGARLLNERIHYVDFVAGIGVLDLEALAMYRPDWVQMDAETKCFAQSSGVPLDEYIAYFENHGALVTAISIEDAALFRSAIQNKDFRAINGKWGDALKEKFVVAEPEPKKKKEELSDD
jgi:hypothetical protein